MKMQQILTEHKKLNQAIKHLEHSKDNLYDYIGDDEYAKESIRSWFPIDDFISAIGEGKELPHSDILKIIKVLDDIIFSIVNGTKNSKKF